MKDTVIAYLSITAGILGIMGVGASIGIYYMKTTVEIAIAKLSSELIAKITTQASGFQTLREDILQKIDAKLDEYVRNQQFKDYYEGHSKKHDSIDIELIRIRDWKHLQDPNIRSLASKIDDLEQWRKVATDDISKLQINIATNNEKLDHLENR